MKYAAGPTVEVEVDVNAPIERVWALVIDIHIPSQFSSEQQGCNWIDGATEPALGARFVGTNTHAAIPRPWETTSTVTEYEPRRSFGWTVGDPAHPAAKWRFDLEAHPHATRLRQWAQIGPGPSGLSPAIEARPDREERIVERRLEEHRANMTATINGIKALAEATE